MQNGSSLLTVDMPCDDAAPWTIRHSMTPLEQLEWVLGDAMIIATELVTNAVLHSGCTPEDLIRVRITRGNGRIMISVSDPGRSGSPRVSNPYDVGPAAGLGLAIVSALATKWGTERERGFHVWAELAA